MTPQVISPKSLLSGSVKSYQTQPYKGFAAMDLEVPCLERRDLHYACTKANGKVKEEEYESISNINCGVLNGAHRLHLYANRKGDE